MIRINLLGDSTAIDHSGKILFGGYLASVVVTIGICFSLYSSITNDVSNLNQNVSLLKSDLESLTEKTKIVKDLEKKRDTLTKKIDLIARLKRSKVGPVRVMDDLNVAIPERVWLRDVTESSGGIRIKGRALDNQDVSLFIRNLDTSNYFSNVDLVESRQMYYSKATGKVSATPDLKRFKTGDFASDSRVTIRKGGDDKPGKKWAAKSNTGDGRKALVDDLNVKIKEFIISAKVDYAGQAGVVKAEVGKSEGKKKG